MRILFSTVAPFPSGTANAVHTVASAQALAAAGHDVDVVRSHPGPGWPEGGTPPDTSGFALRTFAGHDHRGQSIINFVWLRRLARTSSPDLGFADGVRGAPATRDSRRAGHRDDRGTHRG